MAAATAHGPRPLGNELMLLDHGQDGGGNLVLPHGHHVVHVLLCQGKGDLPGVLNGDAVGKRMDGVQGNGVLLPEALGHAGALAAWTP